MSHVTTASGIEIKDLECLKKAAASCGCEWNEGATEFRTFAGNKGKCLHTISHNSKSVTYEIGVNQNADGTYRLDVDNWNNMGGLAKHVGKDAGRLLQNYTAFVAKKQLRKQGWRFKKDVVTENGCLQLVAQK